MGGGEPLIRQRRFQKRMSLQNYSGTRFEMEVDRTVRLLSGGEIAMFLGDKPGDAVRTVAFESANTVSNIGAEAWRPESGLVSVWILGMFNPSPSTTIAIPFAEGSEAALGPDRQRAYFGKVPGDRLVVKAPLIFFRGDGQYRGKIGLSPARALPIAGSYDAMRACSR